LFAGATVQPAPAKAGAGTNGKRLDNSHKLSNVMAGHSRPKDGTLSHAYVPAIRVFDHCKAV